MAINVADNFGYLGKKGNFSRDQFATVADMKAFPETDIDEGHISFCLGDGKRYEFRSSNGVDGTTGRWREYRPTAEVEAATETEVVGVIEGLK